MVGIPHETLGEEPFGIVKDFRNGKTSEMLQSSIVEQFGSEYALGGVVSLGQLGISGWPLNATNKIMKIELKDAVIKYRNQIHEP